MSFIDGILGALTGAGEGAEKYFEDQNKLKQMIALFQGKEDYKDKNSLRDYMREMKAKQDELYLKGKLKNKIDFSSYGADLVEKDPVLSFNPYTPSKTLVRKGGGKKKVKRSGFEGSTEG